MVGLKGTDLIKVRLSDHLGQWRAGILYKLPYVKQILDKDPAAREVKLELNLASFTRALEHVVEGAKPSIQAIKSLRVLGLQADFENIQGSIPVCWTNPQFVDDKGFGANGAILTLAARGAHSKLLNRTPTGDSDVLGSAHYAWTVHRISIPNLNFGRTEAVLIPKFQDCFTLLTWKVILPDLPEGTTWRDDVLDLLLENWFMQVGGTRLEGVDGLSNNTIAKSWGFWPKKSNAYKGQSPEFKKIRSAYPWMVLIPIMFHSSLSEKYAFPNSLVCFQDVKFYFTVARLGDLVDGPVPSGLSFTSRLEIDSIYLDTKPRANLLRGTPTLPEEPAKILLNDDLSTFDPNQDVKIPKVNLDQPELPGKVGPSMDRQVKSFQSAKFQLQPCVVVDKITGVSFGLIMNMRCPDLPPLQKNKVIYPFLSVQVLANTCSMQTFDVQDTAEWNWVKCGKKAPGDQTYLLLMSPTMFDEKPSAHVDLARIDTVYLNFELNPEWSHLNWEVTITNVGQNIWKHHEGMATTMFNYQ